MRQRIKRKDKTVIAIVLCFCVIALASVFTLKSNINRVDNRDGEEVDATKQVEENKVEEPKEKQVSKVKIPIVDNTQKNSHTPESEFIAPLKGKIIVKYSGKGLVYSKTLDQYMEHKAIDIKGSLDSQVKAAGDGTVSDVYDDKTMGITIVINHGNGISTVYSNLSTAELVEKGDSIKKGQVISGVGDTALFECSDESHLHFEVIKDGEKINPKSIISL